MEFDETPRFWYPRIAHDAWIDFSSQTVELRPLERWENLPFCFSISFPFNFLFSFSPLDCINRMVPKVGNFLPTSSFATCYSHIFLNFFHFPLFSSCDTWLNVSHLSQFAPTHGYHAMCPAPRVSCGIHMVLPCIT